MKFSLFLAILEYVLQCVFLILHVFQCLSAYSRSYTVCLIFQIFSFLTTFQVIQCVFLIFLIFQCFLPYSKTYRVFVSFSTYFSLLTIIQVLECVFLIFQFFHYFSAFSRSYSVCVVIFLICQCSRHIPGPTECVSHFARVSVFLAIFQFLPCEFLIFICQFSRHIPGPTVCVSHFSRFLTFLAIIQVLQCTFLIFHPFQCFSPYSRSYHVSFSISLLVSFLTIIQVLQCIFHIFHVFHCFSPYSRFHSECVSFSKFSRHIPVSTMCVSHFHLAVFLPYSRSYRMCVSFSTFFSVSCHIPGQFLRLIFHLFKLSYHISGPRVCSSHFACFSEFLAIIQDLQCVFLIFHVFHCFWLYSRSYSEFFPFCKYFSVSRHIPGTTVCISHFARFSVFFTIIQVLPYEFLIFLICQFSRNIPGPTVCVSNFPLFFFSFLAINQILHFAFLIFQIFQCFPPYSRSNIFRVSSSTFLRFLAIFQVVECVFFILHVFSVSCHVPRPIVFVSLFPRFSVFSP